MRSVKRELDICTMDIRVNADYVYIADLADVHVGADSHNERKFAATVSKIASIPNLYVIIGGDCTESSGLSTTSSVFDEESHGFDQVKRIKHLLMPIRDRILFIRSGNHGQERAMRSNKMAPEEVLAELLDVPYFRGFGCAIVNARKNTYVIGTQHTAKKPDKFDWLETDIMFHEHRHLQGFTRDMCAKVNRFTKKWEVRMALNIQAGSFLNWGGYAKDKMYRPLATGCPVVELCGKVGQWGMTVYENIDQFLRAVE